MARRRQGGKKRGSLVGTLVFALALLLMWLGSELGLVSWGGGGPGAELVTTPPPEDALFAAFIDVGQGDSAFVSCGGETLLIDAGISSAGGAVADYLRSRGVDRLDYVVCTHAHEDHCGGLERFVAEMNRKAAELGMTGTSFANPNGLDQEGHYSTARDMARLAACAVKNETLVRLCSTRSVTVGGRTMTNHNRLLRSIDGCIGLKTGYTRAAGRTLVSCVRRNGRTLVAVTLQDGNDWADHAALYEFGFGP